MSLGKRALRRQELAYRAHGMMLEGKSLTETSKTLKTTIKSLKRGFREIGVKRRKDAGGRHQLIGESRKREDIPEPVPTVKPKGERTPFPGVSQGSHGGGVKWGAAGYDAAEGFIENNFNTDGMDANTLNAIIRSHFYSETLQEILIDRFLG